MANILVILKHDRKTKLEDGVKNTAESASIALGYERRSARSLASLALARGKQTVNRRGCWRCNERD